MLHVTHAHSSRYTVFCDTIYRGDDLESADSLWQINYQDTAWRQFITLLEHKGDVYGAHVVPVDLGDTTNECTRCGIESTKSIQIREHTCPACGFQTEREVNAACNVLKHSYAERGMGQLKRRLCRPASLRSLLVARRKPIECTAGRRSRTLSSRKPRLWLRRRRSFMSQ